MATTESWRLVYRDRFRSLYLEEFQAWFETLLRALHYAGDFQAIRKTSGDGGLDAFVISSQLVYQVYAPTRINELRDSETAAKIRGDFEKAQRTLAGELKGWTFVHNHPDGKIGHLTAAALSKIKRRHPDITFQILDINSLLSRLEELPHRTIEKLFGRGNLSENERAPASHRNAEVTGEASSIGKLGTRNKPRYIFLQFLNPEIRALYQTDTSRSPQQLHREWIRISKFALLVAEQGLAIPASYLFEVPELNSLLEDMQAVRKQGLLHIASPTPDLSLYAGDKRREYRDELALFPGYAGQDTHTENGQLIWVPRVRRSASGDISMVWRAELEHEDGLWHQLLRSKESRQLTFPSVLETAIHTVPDLLDGRAFIYRFARRLLPFALDSGGETKLKLLISREYLRSYLLELEAAVLIETPIGSLDCGIETFSAAGNVQTISWRAIADCFETLGIRAHVEQLSWSDLLRLRGQPVLHWLMELVLTSSQEGRNVFEEIVNLSGFRASEPLTRSRNRRPYDIVRDQIWRFQFAAGPVLYSHDWSELAVASTVRHLQPPRRRRRIVSDSPQLTMLQDICDVGVVVALPEEFRELQRQLADRWKPLYDKATATEYYLFTIEGPVGTAPYSCVTTFAGSMGPTKAALLTEKLRTRWKVGAIVNVGIAGALNEDVKIGDVVVGALADNYLERAKAIEVQGEDGFAFELAGEPFRSSRALLDACMHMEFAQSDLFAMWQQAGKLFLHALTSEKLTALREAKLLAGFPMLLHGHVACGTSVGASIAFKRWLKKRDRSYLAIDMESGGVLLAVYEAARATEGLVLRGISDFADERKAELDRIGKGDFRRYAMHNALQFLWILMRAGRLPRSV